MYSLSKNNAFLILRGYFRFTQIFVGLPKHLPICSIDFCWCFLRRYYRGRLIVMTTLTLAWPTFFVRIWFDPRRWTWLLLLVENWPCKSLLMLDRSNGCGMVGLVGWLKGGMIEWLMIRWYVFKERIFVFKPEIRGNDPFRLVCFKWVDISK